MFLKISSALAGAALGLTLTASEPVYTFSDKSTSDWFIVDDGVMGGLSQGHFESTDEGHSRFWGDVSLENNGGFSSVRLRQNPVDMTSYGSFKLNVKGDGKDYQFRVKSSSKEYYSYIYTFSTSGEWEEIEIPFDEMVPSFRGRLLNQPPFPGEVCAEMAFLIANKKAESFSIELKEIQVVKK